MREWERERERENFWKKKMREESEKREEWLEETYKLGGE